MSNIIKRELLDLPDSKLKLIRSGWGNECVEETKVEKITYLSDGFKVKGYLAYPKKSSET